MDMCVKTEPDEEDISQPAYCTEVQSFSAEEMDSGLHLDTERIKTETVMVKIMEDDDNLQLCSNTEELCPPSQQLNSSTGLLSTQCKSETGEVKVEQYPQSLEPSATEKELGEVAHCDIKGECEELQVNELITFPCPLYEQCKSETDDVKVEQHFQLDGSFSRDTAFNEAEYDLLQRNSAELEGSLITTGCDIKCCIQCGASFSQTCQLKQHQLVCSGKQYEYSPYRKNSWSGNSEHQVIHSAEKPYKCSECGKSFSQGSKLKRHQLVHSGEKAYTCNKCGNRFTYGSDLKKHQVIHSGAKLCKCSECGKSFSHASNLKKHQFLHSGEKPYKCNECGKSFSIGSNLKKHQLLHSGEKSYKCTECGKTFSRVGNLKQHQLLHSGEKLYKCSECDKSFFYASNLKTHQLIHSGVKPYQCNKCGKRFSQSNHLKVHQVVHSGEKPYKCSDCGNSFSQVSTLKEHQLLHNGEKPYKCDCGKSFSRSNRLKNHQLVHSAEKMYKFCEF